MLNKPVMEHIAELLAKHGFTEVIANLSYMPEQIRAVFGDGSGHGIELSYSEEPEPLGTAGWGRQGPRLPLRGRFVPGHLRRRADRHRSRRHARRPRKVRGRGRDRHPGDEAGQGHDPVRGRDHRRRRSHPGFQEKPDPAEALSDLANCGIYMFTSDIFDHFPGSGHHSAAGDDDQPEGFVDWAQDVFPALLDGDVPFYSHEIDAYWNDIGNLDELRQGNFDALRWSS